MAAGYVLAAGWAPLYRLEAETLDLRFRLRGPIAPGPETVIVLIDDATLAELGRWPLSRRHFATAVERLAADGAKVVAFDLLFVEPEAEIAAEERAGIAAARDALAAGQPAEARARLDQLLATQTPDQRFAEALAGTGDTILPFAFVFDPAEANVDDLPDPILDSAFLVYRVLPGAETVLPLRPAGLLAPVPELAAAAASVAHVTIAYDRDGTLRWDHPVIRFDGELFPSLPIAAARAYLDIPLDKVSVQFGQGIAIGDRRVPTDTAMRYLVNYLGPRGTFPTYSFHDLVAGRLSAETFAGKIVLIGGSAIGLADTFATPFTVALPGVERYAGIIDNILHEDFVTRPSWATAADVALIIGLGLVALLIAVRPPMRWSAVLVTALFLLWLAGASFAFTEGRVWLNVVFPTASLLLAYAVPLAQRMVVEERRRRRAERHRANLARYFSPRIVGLLAERDRPLAFDSLQTAAVMFVDIKGFTRACEQLPPADAIALLREFHELVERAVFEHSGTLDKFLGDGAMATFGVPDPDPGDAVNALACARRVAADIARWGQALAAQGQAALAVGIGIHYGPVVMGDVGGGRRLEFTVIGDTVNVARRLESMTRQHNATILVSEALMAAARTSAGADEGFLPLTPQPVRGREGHIDVWVWRGASARQGEGADEGVGIDVAAGQDGHQRAAAGVEPAGEDGR